VAIVSDANLRQLRVLHIVSSGGVAASLQQTLFMPLLTRMPKARVKAQVACLAPGAVPAAVLRQNGVPVHDIALSRRRFSFGAWQDLLQVAKQFRPDVIQAWGHTAQIASVALRSRCDGKPRLVWSVSDTAPLARDAGLIDRRKLKLAAKLSARVDRVVYASEAGASQHRRAGFPEEGHLVVPPGIDATRFKVDFAARRKVREQLELGADAFVIGMVAPFQPESDHVTFMKAVGELIKTHPHITVVLAGHGVQKGNAPLMALVGGGTLGTRTQLLGEWSDVASLFNACDIVCSSALNDSSRMMLVMAMLCGIPCVATGMGAQGEVIGQHGVAIEPGSPAAFIKGINRVLQLTPEKRAHMAHGARKHALQNYVFVRSLQKYLQLYSDLVGREALVVSEAVPVPEIDASVPVPPPLPKEIARKKSAPVIAELSDPDSLEAKVAEQSAEDLPKWRVEQEQARTKRETELSRQVAASQTAGDVLQVFEAEISKPSKTAASPMSERARGVTEDVEDLLAPEILETPVQSSQRAPAAAVNVSKPQPVAPVPLTNVAPIATPLVTPVAANTEPETLSLFGAEAAAPVAARTPQQAEETTFQLELLSDEVVERKQAAGGSI
jgi:glycosyltransferase involved in cell wall biosynthesis